jgi:gas vesicle protein GvpL/GvpF
MPVTTPARRTTKQMGCYLYAIIAGADQEQLAPLGSCGIDGSQVYAVKNDGLVAIVSDVPNARLRPERRRLAAHHDVLERLLGLGTPLPMAFGIIADGAHAIEHILALNRQVFSKELVRLDGKVEMGLRVAWDVPNIFEYFVATHPELRALRDRAFGAGSEPTWDDSIELGRLFHRTLTREREVQTEKVLGTLNEHCVEVKENKPRNEREVMSLACLIRRDAAKDFQRGVFETATQLDNHYAFDFNGPWPAHNFVEVDLQT